MKPFVIMTRVCLALFAITIACTAAAAPTATAFVHVNVVPMDRERVLLDQTVIVEGALIKAVGHDLPVPANAQVIDGTGKYLSPGLSDMHTHSESREEMKVYLANGVTSLLNLGGASSDFVDQRVPLLNRAERAGPHVYVALRIDGTPQYGQLVVRTPAEGRAVVRLARSNGYQFIKVYNNLSAKTYAAVADEARRQGLGIAGHYVRALTLADELKPGHVLVAHLEELMYGLFRPGDADPLAPPSAAVIAKAADILKASRAFVVADLGTFQTIAAQWGRPAVASAMFNRPEARYVPPGWRLDWQRGDYTQKSGSLERRAAFEARLAKGLSDAKIPLLAGTDAPTIPGIYPGFSLHDDLDSLVAAGLTRFEALSTATRTAGEYIRASIKGAEPFGEVKEGYRADMILSDRNPLDDLRTLRQPRGVMAGGRYYPAGELGSMLGSVASDYARASAMGSGKP